MGKRSKQRKMAKAKAMQKAGKNQSDSDCDSDSGGETEAKEIPTKKTKLDPSNSQFAINAKSLPTQSFDGLSSIVKHFWVGPVPDETPSTELKESRKRNGILVKGSVHLCPPQIETLQSDLLPTSFKKVFVQLGLKQPSTVQSQAWPAILYGANVTWLVLFISKFLVELMCLIEHHLPFVLIL